MPNWLAEALQSQRIVFRDVPRDSAVTRSHLTLATRLRTSAGEVIGAVVLGIDPSIPRYRLILTWPSDSRSGDVLLVKRDEDDALYLSAPRRQPGSAMTLRENISNGDSPVVRAALRVEGASPGASIRRPCDGLGATRTRIGLVRRRLARR